MARSHRQRQPLREPRRAALSRATRRRQEIAVAATAGAKPAWPRLPGQGGHRTAGPSPPAGDVTSANPLVGAGHPAKPNFKGTERNTVLPGPKDTGAGDTMSTWVPRPPPAPSVPSDGHRTPGTQPPALHPPAACGGGRQAPP